MCAHPPAPKRLMKCFSINQDWRGVLLLSFHEEEAENLAGDYGEHPWSHKVERALMADALHHQAHLTHRTSRTLEVLCGKWKRAQQLLYRNSQHNGVASAKLAEEINIVILLSEQSFTLKNFFFFALDKVISYGKAWLGHLKVLIIVYIYLKVVVVTFFFLATQDRVKPSVRMLSYKSQAKSNHTSLEKV